MIQSGLRRECATKVVIRYDERLFVKTRATTEAHFTHDWGGGLNQPPVQFRSPILGPHQNWSHASSSSLPDNSRPHS
jgi:hypothetical protein